jgi:hypothetical protein
MSPLCMGRPLHRGARTSRRRSDVNAKLIIKDGLQNEAGIISAAVGYRCMATTLCQIVVAKGKIR